MPKLVFYMGVGGQNNVCIIMILFCGMISLSHRHSQGFGTRFLHQTKPENICMGGYMYGMSRTTQDLKVSLKECIKWLIYILLVCTLFS